jgi:hypothetical protein
METFKPRCTHGDVIAMRSAMFGRMHVGRCITSDAFKLQQLEPDSLGCAADVLGYFDRTCSGKSACDVLIPNPDLYNYRPCSAQLTMYLEASYVCVSGKYAIAMRNSKRMQPAGELYLDKTRMQSTRLHAVLNVTYKLKVVASAPEANLTLLICAMSHYGSEQYNEPVLNGLNP